MKRRAKIVATLGPATADQAVLVQLLKGGADVISLNLSHGSPESHRRNLRRVRKVARSLDLQVSLLLDLIVAPGIAEALIATIAGLGTAIPALVFFNMLTNRLRRVEGEMQSFAISIVDLLEREVRSQQVPS